MAERIAIICAADRWAGPARTAAALTHAGAEVCMVAPPQAYAAKTRYKMADVLMPVEDIKRGLPSILKVLAEDFRAHSVLAGDDGAFRALALVLARAAALQLSEATRALLARSMSDAETAALLSKDSDFILAHQDSGPCPAPRTIANPDVDAAARWALGVGYPVVVKRDGFASGLGVKICANESELRAAIGTAPKHTFVVQEYVSGRVYGATVSGVKGQALAAIAFEKHRTSTTNGATSVAKYDPRRDIITHARGLFERYGLNGYAGFDYVIDDQNRARFIEINPRIMPTGHFAECFGVDLTGAFLDGVRGIPSPPPRSPEFRYVALFPNEWMRDPQSEFLHRPDTYHDVPWDDPAVFAAMIDKALIVHTHTEKQRFGAALDDQVALAPGRRAIFGDF